MSPETGSKAHLLLQACSPSTFKFNVQVDTIPEQLRHRSCMWQCLSAAAML